jgi:pimeloyl-ACP methyl ester carboxylesterase
VVIIKSLDPQPKPDPLVVAQGGPGGSTIDTYVNILLGDNDLRTDRDIILFDQRGTLYSKPTLNCTEVDQMTIDTLDEDLSLEEKERLYREALARCYQRLSDRGDNLSAFDSLENAADVDSLRRALNYEQINLYGVSYGTLLALHTMRLFPAGLRSVILDGVVPTQTNFIVNVAQTENRAFSRLFETCRATPDCNRNYPDLEKVFIEVIDQLNREPARVQFIDPENGTVYENVVINGDTFLSGAFQFMYSSDLVEALPRIIYDARRGNLDVFARIMSIFVLDRTTSYGMYYSVLCAEDADFIPTDQDLTGVRPEIVAVEENSPENFLAACEIWKVLPLASDVDAPVVSNIPTLVLSGGFDPITPPDYAQTAAQSLSRSYSFVFPTGAHGQALDSDCSDGIINRFLANPTTAPDASCIDANATPRFYTSKTIVGLPFILKVMNLQGMSWLIFVLLILALVFLWTTVLVFPLAWVIGVLRGKPATPAPTSPPGLPADPFAANPDPVFNAPVSVPPAVVNRPTFLARFSAWWPVLAAAVLTVFLVFLIATTFSMIAENDNRLVFGMPGETRPWFLLPIVFALLSLAMLVAGIQAWAGQLGPVWRRVYYTLLALDALVAVLLLALLGLLTAFF